MKKYLPLFLFICLWLSIPTKIRAADNMCNVNPGTCKTQQDWEKGWSDARKEENRDAAPKQTEWTNANEGKPEVIRLSGESNAVNRSEKAAEDSKKRGKDKINPDEITRDPVAVVETNKGWQVTALPADVPPQTVASYQGLPQQTEAVVAEEVVSPSPSPISAAAQAVREAQTARCATNLGLCPMIDPDSLQVVGWVPADTAVFGTYDEAKLARMNVIVGTGYKTVTLDGQQYQAYDFSGETQETSLTNLPAADVARIKASAEANKVQVDAQGAMIVSEAYDIEEFKQRVDAFYDEQAKIQEKIAATVASNDEPEVLQGHAQGCASEKNQEVVCSPNQLWQYIEEKTEVELLSVQDRGVYEEAVRDYAGAALRVDTALRLLQQWLGHNDQPLPVRDEGLDLFWKEHPEFFAGLTQEEMEAVKNAAGPSILQTGGAMARTNQALTTDLKQIISECLRIKNGNPLCTQDEAYARLSTISDLPPAYQESVRAEVKRVEAIGGAARDLALLPEAQSISQAVALEQQEQDIFNRFGLVEREDKAAARGFAQVIAEGIGQANAEAVNRAIEAELLPFVEYVVNQGRSLAGHDLVADAKKLQAQAELALEVLANPPQPAEPVYGDTEGECASWAVRLLTRLCAADEIVDHTYTEAQRQQMRQAAAIVTQATHELFLDYGVVVNPFSDDFVNRVEDLRAEGKIDDETYSQILVDQGKYQFKGLIGWQEAQRLGLRSDPVLAAAWRRGGEIVVERAVCNQAGEDCQLVNRVETPPAGNLDPFLPADRFNEQNKDWFITNYRGDLLLQAIGNMRGQAVEPNLKGRDATWADEAWGAMRGLTSLVNLPALVISGQLAEKFEVLVAGENVIDGLNRVMALDAYNTIHRYEVPNWWAGMFTGGDIGAVDETSLEVQEAAFGRALERCGSVFGSEAEETNCMGVNGSAHRLAAAQAPTEKIVRTAYLGGAVAAGILTGGLTFWPTLAITVPVDVLGSSLVLAADQTTNEYVAGHYQNQAAQAGASDYVVQMAAATQKAAFGEAATEFSFNVIGGMVGEGVGRGIARGLGWVGGKVVPKPIVREAAETVTTDALRAQLELVVGADRNVLGQVAQAADPKAELVRLANEAGGRIRLLSSELDEGIPGSVTIRAADIDFVNVGRLADGSVGGLEVGRRVGDMVVMDTFNVIADAGVVRQVDQAISGRSGLGGMWDRLRGQGSVAQRVESLTGRPIAEIDEAVREARLAVTSAPAPVARAPVPEPVVAEPVPLAPPARPAGGEAPVPAAPRAPPAEPKAGEVRVGGREIVDVGGLDDAGIAAKLKGAGVADGTSIELPIRGGGKKLFVIEGEGLVQVLTDGVTDPNTGRISLLRQIKSSLGKLLGSDEAALDLLSRSMSSDEVGVVLKDGKNVLAVKVGASDGLLTAVERGNQLLEGLRQHLDDYKGGVASFKPEQITDALEVMRRWNDGGVGVDIRGAGFGKSTIEDIATVLAAKRGQVVVRHYPTEGAVRDVLERLTAQTRTNPLINVPILMIEDGKFYSVRRGTGGLVTELVADPQRLIGNKGAVVVTHIDQSGWMYARARVPEPDSVAAWYKGIIDGGGWKLFDEPHAYIGKTWTIRGKAATLADLNPEQLAENFGSVRRNRLPELLTDVLESNSANKLRTNYEALLVDSRSPRELLGPNRSVVDEQLFRESHVEIIDQQIRDSASGEARAYLQGWRDVLASSISDEDFRLGLGAMMESAVGDAALKLDVDELLIRQQVLGDFWLTRGGRIAGNDLDVVEGVVVFHNRAVPTGESPSSVVTQAVQQLEGLRMLKELGREGMPDPTSIDIARNLGFSLEQHSATMDDLFGSRAVGLTATADQVAARSGAEGFGGQMALPKPPAQMSYAPSSRQAMMGLFFESDVSGTGLRGKIPILVLADDGIPFENQTDDFLMGMNITLNRRPSKLGVATGKGFEIYDVSWPANNSGRPNLTKVMAFDDIREWERQFLNLDARGRFGGFKGNPEEWAFVYHRVEQLDPTIIPESQPIVAIAETDGAAAWTQATNRNRVFSAVEAMVDDPDYLARKGYTVAQIDQIRQTDYWMAVRTVDEVVVDKSGRMVNWVGNTREELKAALSSANLASGTVVNRTVGGVRYVFESDIGGVKVTPLGRDSIGNVLVEVEEKAAQLSRVEGAVGKIQASEREILGQIHEQLGDVSDGKFSEALAERARTIQVQRQGYVLRAGNGQGAVYDRAVEAHQRLRQFINQLRQVGGIDESRIDVLARQYELDTEWPLGMDKDAFLAAFERGGWRLSLADGQLSLTPSQHLDAFLGTYAKDIGGATQRQIAQVYFGARPTGEVAAPMSLEAAQALVETRVTNQVVTALGRALVEKSGDLVNAVRAVVGGMAQLPAAAVNTLATVVRSAVPDVVRDLTPEEIAAAVQKGDFEALRGWTPQGRTAVAWVNSFIPGEGINEYQSLVDRFERARAGNLTEDQLRQENAVLAQALAQVHIAAQVAKLTPEKGAQPVAQAPGVVPPSGPGPVGEAVPAPQAAALPECVTGDTKLRRRRRRKKRDGTEEEYWEEVPIVDIKPGDFIQTLEETSGKLVKQRVVRVVPKGTQPVLRLTTSSGKSIRTTAVHPYFVNRLVEQKKTPTKGEGEVTVPILTYTPFAVKEGVWQRADQVKVGARIAVVGADGRPRWDTVVSVASEKRQNVYDIEVEGTHNFVGNGIVAHNTSTEFIPSEAEGLSAAGTQVAVPEVEDARAVLEAQQQLNQYLADLRQGGINAGALNLTGELMGDTARLGVALGNLVIEAIGQQRLADRAAIVQVGKLIVNLVPGADWLRQAWEMGNVANRALLALNDAVQAVAEAQKQYVSNVSRAIDLAGEIRGGGLSPEQVKDRPELREGTLSFQDGKTLTIRYYVQNLESSDLGVKHVLETGGHVLGIMTGDGLVYWTNQELAPGHLDLLAGQPAVVWFETGFDSKIFIRGKDVTAIDAAYMFFRRAGAAKQAARLTKTFDFWHYEDRDVVFDGVFDQYSPHGQFIKDSEYPAKSGYELVEADQIEGVLGELYLKEIEQGRYLVARYVGVSIPPAGYVSGTLIAPGYIPVFEARVHHDLGAIIYSLTEEATPLAFLRDAATFIYRQDAGIVDRPGDTKRVFGDFEIAWKEVVPPVSLREVHDQVSWGNLQSWNEIVVDADHPQAKIVGIWNPYGLSGWSRLAKGFGVKEFRGPLSMEGGVPSGPGPVGGAVPAPQAAEVRRSVEERMARAGQQPWLQLTGGVAEAVTPLVLPPGHPFRSVATAVQLYRAYRAGQMREILAALQGEVLEAENPRVVVTLESNSLFAVPGVEQHETVFTDVEPDFQNKEMFPTLPISDSDWAQTLGRTHAPLKANASQTERKTITFSLPSYGRADAIPVIFQASDGTKFGVIYRKGVGGVRRRPSNNFSELFGQETSGLTRDEPRIGLTHNLDFERDSGLSLQWNSKGMRVRVPIASFRLKSIPITAGVVSIEEAIQQGIIGDTPGYGYPVISVWARRNPFTFRDALEIVTHTYDNTGSRPARLGEMKNNFEALLRAQIPFLQLEVSQQARLAVQQIQENRYEEWFAWLAKTAGEEAGKAAKNGFLQGNMNPQNLTLAIEAGDLGDSAYDVTEDIGGKIYEPYSPSSSPETRVHYSNQALGYYLNPIIRFRVLFNIANSLPPDTGVSDIIDEFSTRLILSSNRGINLLFDILNLSLFTGKVDEFGYPIGDKLDAFARRRDGYGTGTVGDPFIAGSNYTVEEAIFGDDYSGNRHPNEWLGKLIEDNFRKQLYRQLVRIPKALIEFASEPPAPPPGGPEGGIPSRPGPVGPAEPKAPEPVVPIPPVSEPIAAASERQLVRIANRVYEEAWVELSILRDSNEILDFIETDLRSMGVEIRRGGNPRVATKGSRVIKNIQGLEEIYLQVGSKRVAVIAHEWLHVKQVQALLEAGIPTGLVENPKYVHIFEAPAYALGSKLAYTKAFHPIDAYVQPVAYVFAKGRLIGILNDVNMAISGVLVKVGLERALVEPEGMVVPVPVAIAGKLTKLAGSGTIIQSARKEMVVGLATENGTKEVKLTVEGKTQEEILEKLARQLDEAGVILGTEFTLRVPIVAADAAPTTVELKLRYTTFKGYSLQGEGEQVKPASLAERVDERIDPKTDCLSGAVGLFKVYAADGSDGGKPCPIWEKVVVKVVEKGEKVLKSFGGGGAPKKTAAAGGGFVTGLALAKAVADFSDCEVSSFEKNSIGLASKIGISSAAKKYAEKFSERCMRWPLEVAPPPVAGISEELQKPYGESQHYFCDDTKSDNPVYELLPNQILLKVGECGLQRTCQQNKCILNKKDEITMLGRIGLLSGGIKNLSELRLSDYSLLPDELHEFQRDEGVRFFFGNGVGWGTIGGQLDRFASILKVCKSLPKFWCKNMVFISNDLSTGADPLQGVIYIHDYHIHSVTPAEFEGMLVHELTHIQAESLGQDTNTSAKYFGFYNEVTGAKIGDSIHPSIKNLPLYFGLDLKPIWESPVDYAFNYVYLAEYMALSGWYYDVDKSQWRPASNGVPLEIDFQNGDDVYKYTNPSESIASMAENYYRDSSKLKDEYPEIYNYLNIHFFDGREYKDGVWINP